MKLRTSHRYRAWGTIGFAVVAFVVYGVGVFYMSRQQQLIDEQIEALAFETGREQSMHSVVSLLDDIDTETQAIEGFFIAPDDAVGFIELLEGLSSIVGTPVSISNVRAEGSDEATGEGTLVVNVSATGSWRSVYHVLTILTTLPVETTISSVSLLRAEAGDGGAVWTLRATVETLLRH